MRLELLGGPLERAGLGREADEDRDAARSSRGRPPTAPGQQVGRRLEIEGQAGDPGELRSRPGWRGRKSATAAAMTRASKPARPSRRRPRAGRSGPASSSAVLSTRATVGSGRRGTSTLPAIRLTRRASVEGGLGDRDAHPAARPIADEADRVDRLARAAGGHDDVAAVEIRLAGRPRQAGRPGRRIRAPGSDGRRPPRPRRRRSGRSSASRPMPDLARRQRPGLRLDDGVAEAVAQPGDVGPGRRVGVHLAVHRRRDDDRRATSPGRRP